MYGIILVARYLNHQMNEYAQIHNWATTLYYRTRHSSHSRMKQLNSGLTSLLVSPRLRSGYVLL